jgi:hypothetical protein
MPVRVLRGCQIPLAGLTMPAEFAGKLRRADPFIRLGVAAAAAALARSTPLAEPAASGCGLILATGYGAMQTNFEVLEQIVSGQQTSPTLFSHSVFNAAAGYIATLFNIRGCALTVSDFAFPFFRALAEGRAAVASGRLDLCLVLQVESYSDLLAEARRRLLGVSDAWPPGAVCWLLAKDGEGPRLSGVEIDDQPLVPRELLRGEETLSGAGGERLLAHPLAAAQAITAELARPEVAGGYHLAAAWGGVRLQLSRVGEEVG